MIDDHAGQQRSLKIQSMEAHPVVEEHACYIRRRLVKLELEPGQANRIQCQAILGNQCCHLRIACFGSDVPHPPITCWIVNKLESFGEIDLAKVIPFNW